MAVIRGLRWLLLVGLIVLVCVIVISLSANARPGPVHTAEVPVEPALPANRVAQQASEVEIVRTRRGAPTLRMLARESTTFTNGRLELGHVTFDLFGPDGQETLVKAPSAQMIPYNESTTGPRDRAADTGARESLDAGVGSWILTGGVQVNAADGLVLAMPTMNYDESMGQARTADPVSFTRGTAAGSSSGMVYDVVTQVVHFPQTVEASMPLGSMGLVKVVAESASHDLRKKSFEMMEYRALTGRGETLSGAKLVAKFHESSGLDRLEGDEGFVLESSHALPPAGASASPLARLLALEGTRTMRGQRLAMIFNGGPEPVQLEVSGEANLTTNNVNGRGAPASIAAQTLTFDLKDGNLSRAHAMGSVDLIGAPGEGQSTGLRLKSDDLEAILDPVMGAIQILEGKGAIHLSDQDMESHGNRTALDPNTGIITLTGEAGRPAVATWVGKKIQADRIEADRKRKTLSARGGVRTTFEPPAAQPGEASKDVPSLPFFRGGETVYAMAGSLTFADQGRVAHYSDRVRLWQGDNRIEAGELNLNETDGTLDARTDVISTFRQPPPAGTGASKTPASGSPSDDIVTVAAANMKYDRSANTINYKGNVLVSQGQLRVAADVVVVTLEPDGSSAQRMDAEGNVEMRDEGRTGRGDRLASDLKSNTMKLSGIGREATIQDESGQQVVRGSSLTMDRTGDRILVDSEVGGRTWITLKPRKKGAPALGSDPRN